MKIIATSAELPLVPAAVEGLVPGLDLSLLDKMLAKVRVTKPGALTIAVDTAKGPIEIELDLAP